MKNYLKIFTVAAYAAMMMACSPSEGEHNHNHEHGHEHNHEDSHTHDHEHGADCTHDHNHEAETNNHDDANHSDDEIIFTEHQAKDAGLIFDTITAAPFRKSIKVSGQIIAAQGDERTISATASGIINYVNSSITDGSAVNAGQALFTISTKGISDGDLAATAKIAFENAKKEFERAEVLIKNHIISQKEYDSIKAAYEKAKADLNSVGGRTAISGATITSPISGFLISQLVDHGQYVTVGQPIATISQNRRLQLRADVPERYFGQLQNINSANFILPYDENTTHSLDELNGRLLSFGRATSDNSYFLPAIFEFNNPGNIIPGSFAEIYLLGATQNDALSVPEESITEEQGLFFVYIRIDKECYMKREVKLGQSNGKRVEILAGLHPGDVVVAKGSTHLKLAANTGQIPEGHSHNH